MASAIVALSGKRGAGKSLAANILIKEYGFTRVSFAAPLKEGVKRDFDLTDEQVNGDLKEVVDPRYGKTPREIMIAYGDMFRAIDPDHWVKMAEKQLNSVPGFAVIDDMRFENEAKMLVLYQAYMVRLERLQEDNVYKGEINTPSECALDHFPGFDLRISGHENRTPEQLAFVAERIANALNLHRVITFKVLHSPSSHNIGFDPIDSTGTNR